MNSKKVALISTYCDTEEKISVLEKNMEIIKSYGIDLILISPISLPENIQKKSDYLFIMKDNPLLDWPTKAMFYWRDLGLDNNQIRITKTCADYGWAGLYQVKKLSEIALSFDYEYFYHMIYDLKIDETVINGLLNEAEFNVYPSKRDNTIWEVGLHFMVLNRKKIQELIPQITLSNYLSCRGGDAFVWLKKTKEIVDYKIMTEPVEDEIYLYEGFDFFNSSIVEGLKFFIEKNDETHETIKILFYDIKSLTNVKIYIDEEKYNYSFSENKLIDLGFNKFGIRKVTLSYNNSDYDITEIIKSTKHTTLNKIL